MTLAMTLAKTLAKTLAATRAMPMTRAGDLLAAARLAWSAAAFQRPLRSLRSLAQ